MKVHVLPRRSGHPSESGQSMVELAISLVLLVTIIAAVVDLGLAFINFVAMRDAAQEGALYGSLHPTNCAQIANHALESASTLLEDVQVEVRIDGELCGSGAATASSFAGHTIQVTVSQPDYPITVPFVGSILTLGTNTLNLRATIQDTILTPFD